MDLKHSEEHPQHNQDKLSQLPYHILTDILSLIPIENAAVTSILSRDWRYLWTEITLTHISFLFRRSPMFESFEFFVIVLDQILSQNTSSKFKSLELDVPFEVETIPYIANQLFSNILAPWIEEICSHNLETIKLDLQGLNLDIEMPTCVLKMQSLVHLQLHACRKMVFNLSNEDIFQFIDLPNLKKLDVVLFECQRPVMRTLFESCPLLEDLDMCLNLNEKYEHINIKAPNLKRLVMQIGDKPKGTIFVIDAPKLEYIDADGYLASFEFVNIPKKLQEAIYDDLKVKHSITMPYATYGSRIRVRICTSRH